jgi:hypothetical protein
MSVRLEEKPVARRREMPIESLRALVNRLLGEETDCQGVHIRRIIVTEPDASGCNWEPEWPLFRPANSEPCRSRLRELIGRLRTQYNVEQ